MAFVVRETVAAEALVGEVIVDEVCVVCDDNIGVDCVCAIAIDAKRVTARVIFFTRISIWGR